MGPLNVSIERENNLALAYVPLEPVAIWMRCVNHRLMATTVVDEESMLYYSFGWYTWRLLHPPPGSIEP